MQALKDSIQVNGTAVYIRVYKRQGNTDQYVPINLTLAGCNVDQGRILDKIKKCLEMAKGKGSNPNEAEIALRQAHKLMEAYNLEMGTYLPAWLVRPRSLLDQRAIHQPGGCAWPTFARRLSGLTSSSGLLVRARLIYLHWLRRGTRTGGLRLPGAGATVEKGSTGLSRDAEALQTFNQGSARRCLRPWLD